jgi:N-carbamoylputrescine amidase
MSNNLRVTVCEMNDAPAAFAADWQRLVAHVKMQGSQLVLLPEMPFAAWFGTSPRFDPQVWQEVIAAHDSWMARLQELAPAVVISTRPLNSGQKRLNQGFVWDTRQGYRPAHHKYYLPDDEGFWEASWYQRGGNDFSPISSGEIKMGFLICTELWFMQHARTYGRQGVHLLLTPRATGKQTVDKWLAGGRAAAVVSGAFSLSSNRFDPAADFGGQGWVIGPDGQVLGLTSQSQPFITLEIDLDEAEQAKQTYPRYVQD